MPTRIYHWKHGWIPLDHAAAVSHAKGSESGARRYLADSHAAGHAHESVVGGGYGGGTHVRGLQPVSAEHLPRERHITAAFDPSSRKFALLDDAPGGGDRTAAAIPERLAEHLQGNGHRIQAVFVHDGQKRIRTRDSHNTMRTFAADGSDLHVVDPPKPVEAVPSLPDENPQSKYIETHSVGPSRTGHYAVIKPLSGWGSSDVINTALGEHITGNGHKVINYQRRLVTTVDREGVVRRFKADGSNLDKPVLVKTASSFKRRDIGGWRHTEPHEALNGVNGHAGLSDVPSIKVKRAYVKGNKRVLIEPGLTEAQTAAFLDHVDRAFTATSGSTGHLPVTVHVPAGDRQFTVRHGRMVGGYVYRGDPTRVHINPAYARGDLTTPSSGDWHMDAAKTVHPAVYTITHELGHIVDNANHHTSQDASFEALGRVQRMSEIRGGAAEFHRSQVGQLSQYGRSKVVEGYAEAFAHHHLRGSATPGEHHVAHTTASDAYAARYGWRS